MSMDWITNEFKDLSFGDKRLDRRFIRTMNLLSYKPEDCINRAIEDAAGKKAAYRLFSNENCDHEKILRCHIEKTKERMKDHKIVLSIHDSSYFSFKTKRSIKHLGNIGGGSKDPKGKKIDSHGFIGHYALAVSEDGTPLGLQGVKYWSRYYESPWDKESERWGELQDEVEELYDEDTKMIYLADREADIFELLYQSKTDKIDFVIRSRHDRMIHGNDYYITWTLDKRKRNRDVKFYVPARKEEIEATLKYGVISFNDPKVQRAKHLERKDIKSVKINIVEVKEKCNSEKRLHWTLLTTLPIKNNEDALKIVNYYRQRWHIENI